MCCWRSCRNDSPLVTSDFLIYSQGFFLDTLCSSRPEIVTRKLTAQVKPLPTGYSPQVLQLRWYTCDKRKCCLKKLCQCTEKFSWSSHLMVSFFVRAKLIAFVNIQIDDESPKWFVFTSGISLNNILFELWKKKFGKRSKLSVTK